jgi:hypothetical protein
VAELINNYFLNITGNLNIQAVKDNNPISLLKKNYPYAFPPMQTGSEGKERYGSTPSLSSVLDVGR